MNNDENQQMLCSATFSIKHTEHILNVTVQEY